MTVPLAAWSMSAAKPCGRDVDNFTYRRKNEQCRLQRREQNREDRGPCL
jgi:hypothetical protein